MRVLFVLPGLHRVRRGAEVAFESIANEIALNSEHEVTLIGSGVEIPGRGYSFEHVPAVQRQFFERWPTMPFLRSEFSYEDLTFAAGLMMRPWRDKPDITVTCNYPYTNWALRSRLPGRDRPAHVFVTQNGDWAPLSDQKEFKFFNCDGLVCTNPIYWERNRQRWFSTLIPNGIDLSRFHRGASDRMRLGLPNDRPIVLMVSALESGKRVLEGIHAIAKVQNAFCVLAGDGPLRNEVDQVAAELLPGRFLRGTFPHELMPVLYRSADVFLHTAIRESFGNVYIEALSCGIPVVANDDEVTRWILQDHGYLVDTTIEKLLVDKLEEASRAPAEKAAQGARFAQSRYGWREVANQYCDFLLTVLARLQMNH